MKTIELRPLTKEDDRSDFSCGEPDLDRFPCLGLAYRALRTGGTMPAVLNAANEVAVRAFLDGRIGLAEIAALNESVMDDHEAGPANSFEAVLSADAWARSRAIMKLQHSASAV